MAHGHEAGCKDRLPSGEARGLHSAYPRRPRPASEANPAATVRSRCPTQQGPVCPSSAQSQGQKRQRLDLRSRRSPLEVSGLGPGGEDRDPLSGNQLGKSSDSEWRRRGAGEPAPVACSQNPSPPPRSRSPVASNPRSAQVITPLVATASSSRLPYSWADRPGGRPATYRETRGATTLRSAT